MKQKKLIADADALRQRGLDIVKQQRATRSAATEPQATEPLKVGGDVKAPVVIHRVGRFERPLVAANATQRMEQWASSVTRSTEPV